MIAFLCIFFPPVIAVALTTIIRKEKEKFNNYQYLAYYAVFTVIINGIMFWIISFMFNPHYISSPDVFSTSFSAKYILLSSILAVVLAYVAESLSKLKPLSTDLNEDEETREESSEEPSP